MEPLSLYWELALILAIRVVSEDVLNKQDNECTVEECMLDSFLNDIVNDVVKIYDFDKKQIYECRKALIIYKEIGYVCDAYSHAIGSNSISKNFINIEYAINLIEAKIKNIETKNIIEDKNNKSENYHDDHDWWNYMDAQSLHNMFNKMES